VKTIIIKRYCVRAAVLISCNHSPPEGGRSHGDKAGWKGARDLFNLLFYELFDTTGISFIKGDADELRSK
jgi:hypothetical protein